MNRNAKVTRNRVKKGRLHCCGTGDGLQWNIVKTWKNLLTRKYHLACTTILHNDLAYNSMPKTKLYDWCLYIKINYCTTSIFQQQVWLTYSLNSILEVKYVPNIGTIVQDNYVTPASKQISYLRLLSLHFWNMLIKRLENQTTEWWI